MTKNLSIITKGVPDTPTEVYKNLTGTRQAVLKALNAFAAGDGAYSTATGASDWNFFGQVPLAPYIGSNDSAGHGQFYSIRLTTDTVLTFFTSHYLMGGSGQGPAASVLHAQIQQYQSGKYVCGPITTINLGQSPFPIGNGIHSKPSSATPQIPGVKAIALTPTKVALLIMPINSQAPMLYNVGITGNRVNAVDATLGLNMASASAFNLAQNVMDLEVVPGNTDKVMVLGTMTGTILGLLAFNMLDSAAPTAAGTVYNTGITASGYGSALSLHRKSDPTYVIAGAISATAISARLASFTDSNNTYSSIGAVTPVVTGLTGVAGVQAACLSTGSTYNSAIFYCDTGANTLMYSVPQQSGAAIQTTVNNLNLAMGGSNRCIHRVTRWTDEKVFVSLGCNGLVGYNSSHVATNLFTGTYAINSPVAYGPTVFPFDTAPASFVNNFSTYYSTFNVAWTGATSTNFGTMVNANIYVPVGFPSGRAYAYSDVAKCWFVGHGAKIFAVDDTGTVLAEYKITATNEDNYLIKSVTVSPNGYLIFGVDQVGTYCTVAVGWGSLHSSLSQIRVGICTTALTAGASLATAAFTMLTANGGTYPVLADLYAYLDANNVERLLVISNHYNGTSTYREFYSVFYNVATRAQTVSTTQVTNTGQTATLHAGLYCHTYVFPQTAPSSSAPDGVVRVIGGGYAGGTATSIYYSASVTLSSTNGSANNQLYPGTGLAGFGFLAVSFAQRLRVMAHTVGTTQLRVSVSFNGNSINWAPSDIITVPTGTVDAPALACNNFMWALGMNSTTAGSRVSYGRLYRGADGLAAPSVSYTGTATPNGLVTVKRVGGSSISLFAPGVDVIASGGSTAAPKLFLSLSDGVNDFPINGAAGNLISTGTPYRSTDTYHVPPGYSIKLRADLPLAVDTLLTVLEE